jgi:hypothetical protein
MITLESRPASAPAVPFRSAFGERGLRGRPDTPLLRLNGDIAKHLRHAADWGGLVVTSHEPLASCVSIFLPERVETEGAEVALIGDHHRVRIAADAVTHCEVGIPRSAGWSWSIELAWFGDGRRRLGSVVLTDAARMSRAMTDLGLRTSGDRSAAERPATADSGGAGRQIAPTEAAAPIAWTTVTGNARAGLLARLDAQGRADPIHLACEGRFSAHHYRGCITAAGGLPARYSGEGFCMSLLLDRVDRLESGVDAAGRPVLRAMDALGCSVSIASDLANDRACV